MVKLYGKPSCVQCSATERALIKQGTEFVKIDVSQDEEAYAYIVSLGYQSVPVVETPEEHWSGFRPENIRKLA